MTEVLRPLPNAFSATRTALHVVAEKIVAPARKPDNEISLRATPGGFGTPVFDYDGERCQVRVHGTALIYARGSQERRTELSSLRDAAALVEGLLAGASGLDPAPLELDEASAQALGAWYEFGNSVLEDLRAEAGPRADPSPVSLWPEHFDIAIESGNAAAGARANFGLSPGDEHHNQPYLYVGPWQGSVEGELWNATSFSGAELGYAELQMADDQHRAALEFCRLRRDALGAQEGAA